MQTNDQSGGSFRDRLHHIMMCPLCQGLRWLNVVEAKDDGTESLHLQCTECRTSEQVETAFGLGRGFRLESPARIKRA